MNELLLCAYQLRKFAAAPSGVDVHVLVDDLGTHQAADCRRMLMPWTWARIRNHCSIPAIIDESSLRSLGVADGSVVIVVSQRAAARESVRDASGKLGAHCIEPSFPVAGTLDAHLMREVSFFDFEFGGKNEWDQSPTHYAANCLRQLSSVHCRDVYPTWGFRPIQASRQLSDSQPLHVLDVGCGPVSVLRWGALHDEISITGVDPLLDMYALILARHGLDRLRKIRCDREVTGFAEDLDRLLGNEQFDVVFSRNALDHTQRPVAALEAMSRRLRSKGVAVIQVATREGTRQNWDQLHQTDVYLEGDVLWYSNRDSEPRPLLSAASGLRLTHVEIDTPEWLACSLEKI